MPAKPVVSALFAALLSGQILGRMAFAEPQTPTLVLYPRAAGDAADMQALINLRKELRADGRFSVLTFDPESGTIKRAAADAHHPEWLTQPVRADSDRAALANALGAAFLAVVGQGERRGRSVIHLAETAPALRAWDLTDLGARDGAKALEKQAYDALAHPAAAVATAPATPIAALPAAPLPPVVVPPAVTAAPVVAVPPPSLTPLPVVTVAPLPARKEPSSALPPLPAAPPVSPPKMPPADTAADDSRKAAAEAVAVAKIVAQGDIVLAGGDVVGAIAQYRQAINEAPLDSGPRLKLAQAYLQGGMRDKALDEARRALEVSPTSQRVQQFLNDLDAQSGTSEGALTRYTALIARNPDDPTAHLGLGDALWNTGDLTQAEAEYKRAQQLTRVGDKTPTARLARLYAVQGRFDDSLAALGEVGTSGYPLAVGISQDRMETVQSALTTAHDSYEAGKLTRESFYESAKNASAQAQALAEFVAKVKPPPAYKLSHLHRALAANLLSQEAALLVSYMETSDDTQSAKAAQLEKSAQTELLTARAAEQKQGLWGAKQP